jgi:hypothetical protein
MNRKLLGRVLLATAASLALAGVAHANITPVLTGGPTLVSPGVWQYTYTATLDSDQGMVNGSALAIYDFQGYVGGSATAPAGWVISTPNLAPDGLSANPLPGNSDDPGILDLVFTWNGGAFNNTAVHAPIDFVFTANSTLNGLAPDGYAGSGVINNGTRQGNQAINFGPVSVPATAVPEPATWAMMILGFGMVGYGLRLRRRSSPALA